MSKVRTYFGSITLDDAGEWATVGDFPFDEADAATSYSTRGTPVSSSPNFAALRAWRSRAVPNTVVQVADIQPAKQGACEGLLIGRIDQADRAMLK